MIIKKMKLNFSFLLSFMLHLLVGGLVVFFLPHKSEIVALHFIYDGADTANNLNQANRKKKTDKIKTKVKTAEDKFPTLLAESVQDLSLSKSEIASVMNEKIGQDSSQEHGVETAISRYYQKIKDLLEANKTYPKRARFLGQEGTVVLNLNILRSGEIKGIKVIKKPPYQILVNDALDLVQKVGEFPPIPEDISEDELNLSIPITYRSNN